MFGSLLTNMEFGVCQLCRLCPAPLGVCVFIWVAGLLLLLILLLALTGKRRKKKNAPADPEVTIKPQDSYELPLEPPSGRPSAGGRRPAGSKIPPHAYDKPPGHTPYKKPSGPPDLTAGKDYDTDVLEINRLDSMLSSMLDSINDQGTPADSAYGKQKAPSAAYRSAGTPAAKRSGYTPSAPNPQPGYYQNHPASHGYYQNPMAAPAQPGYYQNPMAAPAQPGYYPPQAPPAQPGHYPGPGYYPHQAAPAQPGYYPPLPAPGYYPVQPAYYPPRALPPASAQPSAYGVSRPVQPLPGQQTGYQQPAYQAPQPQQPAAYTAYSETHPLTPTPTPQPAYTAYGEAGPVTQSSYITARPMSTIPLQQTTYIITNSLPNAARPAYNAADSLLSAQEGETIDTPDEPPIIERKSCKFCGHSMPLESRFCAYCGHSVE